MVKVYLQCRKPHYLWYDPHIRVITLISEFAGHMIIQGRFKFIDEEDLCDFLWLEVDLVSFGSILMTVQTH